MLLAHAAALVWFCADWNRVRIMLYDFSEVQSEEALGAAPEAFAASWRYTEDAPEDLIRF
jgi:hypothetical protein